MLRYVWRLNSVFFQSEDGIRVPLWSRGLGNVYKRQAIPVSRLVVRKDHIKALVRKNPILVTTLNPQIGYNLAAKIAKKAFAENRALKEVALEMCDLSEEELDKALDPTKMTKGGFLN